MNIKLATFRAAHWTLRTAARLFWLASALAVVGVLLAMLTLDPGLFGVMVICVLGGFGVVYGLLKLYGWLEDRV